MNLHIFRISCERRLRCGQLITQRPASFGKVGEIFLAIFCSGFFSAIRAEFSHSCLYTHALFLHIIYPNICKRRCGGDKTMMEYLNYLDLKELINGVIGGAILLGIIAAWSKYTRTGHARRLRNTEEYKSHLDSLAESDRAVVIYGFKVLFSLLGILCLLFSIQTLITLNPERGIFELSTDARELILVFFWFLPALGCFGVSLNFHRLVDYPKSAEKIDKKISKLREKVTRNRQ